MLHIAQQASKKSNYKHKLGAVITKSGRVLAVGYNRVGHKSKYGKWSTSLHAEEMAIIKLLKQKHIYKLPGSKILIVRIKKDGSFGMAKPCQKCLSLIKSVGIREIMYTTDNQLCIKEKLK